MRSKLRSKLQNLGMTGGYQLGMITSFTWSLPCGEWCRGRDSNSHAQLRTTDFKFLTGDIWRISKVCQTPTPPLNPLLYFTSTAYNKPRQTYRTLNTKVSSKVSSLAFLMAFDGGGSLASFADGEGVWLGGSSFNWWYTHDGLIP